MDARAPQNNAAGGKIRALDDVHHIRHVHVRPVDQGERGIDDFAQIVRRDVGRHADGDAAGAIDQKMRKLRRQDRGFLDRFVVVRPPVDRVLVDVVQKRCGGPGEAGLGVAHGRRRIVVHRAEIALAVDQHQPHRPGLRQPHHGVVNRTVAMGVVLAHHVADNQSGFPVRPPDIVAVGPHRIENPPLHRLEPVAHVGQCPGDDHAHRIVEIGAFHLLFDGDGRERHDRLVGGQNGYL